MNHASRVILIVASLAALPGCVTDPSRYVAAGPGGGYVGCRYEPCARDGHKDWSGISRTYRYADRGWYGLGPGWYGASRWYAPYRIGYTPWGFRDPWYDPWYKPWWTGPSTWYPGGRFGSSWWWSLGYGWVSGPWSGSLGYQPWSYSTWYVPGWYGGGWWSSTWHRPYRGYRAPPRERHVDWRPAEGLGVANPRWLPASEEVQRIADRNLRPGNVRALEASTRDVHEPLVTPTEASSGSEFEEPMRLDRSAGRVMPRGAVDGWIAPMPGSRPPAGARWGNNRLAEEPSERHFVDPPPQRYEAPEPIAYEHLLPQRFERLNPASFDRPPQRYEVPEPSRFDPPSAADESRYRGRRFEREDFVPN